MTDEKKDKELITTYDISFIFPITEDEVRAIINKPKSKVSKLVKQYLSSTLYEVCKRIDKEMLQNKEK